MSLPGSYKANVEGHPLVILLNSSVPLFEDCQTKLGSSSFESDVMLLPLPLPAAFRPIAPRPHTQQSQQALERTFFFALCSRVFTVGRYTRMTLRYLSHDYTAYTAQSPLVSSPVFLSDYLSHVD